MTDTRTQLLDAAEALFAAGGLEGASLRAITSAAEANLAAVHYHFGSKEALFAAVVQRRVGPINEERLRRLDVLDSSKERPGSAEVMRAFVEPVLEFLHASEQRSQLVRLMGRVLTDTHRAHGIAVEEMAPVVMRFVAALGRARPELSPEEVLWRFHFAVGSLAFTLLHAWHLEELSQGLCDPSDVDALVDRLVGFMAAGIDGPVPDSEGTVGQ